MKIKIIEVEKNKADVIGCLAIHPLRVGILHTFKISLYFSNFYISLLTISLSIIKKVNIRAN